MTFLHSSVFCGSDTWMDAVEEGEDGYIRTDAVSGDLVISSGEGRDVVVCGQFMQELWASVVALEAANNEQAARVERLLGEAEAQSRVVEQQRKVVSSMVASKGEERGVK